MIVIDEISANEHVVGFRSFALRLVICLKAVTVGWQWIFLFLFERRFDFYWVGL